MSVFDTKISKTSYIRLLGVQQLSFVGYPWSGITTLMKQLGERLEREDQGVYFEIRGKFLAGEGLNMMVDCVARECKRKLGYEPAGREIDTVVQGVLDGIDGKRLYLGITRFDSLAAVPQDERDKIARQLYALVEEKQRCRLMCESCRPIDDILCGAENGESALAPLFGPIIRVKPLDNEEFDEFCKSQCASLEREVIDIIREKSQRYIGLAWTMLQAIVCYGTKEERLRQAQSEEMDALVQDWKKRAKRKRGGVDDDAAVRAKDGEEADPHYKRYEFPPCRKQRYEGWMEAGKFLIKEDWSEIKVWESGGAEYTGLLARRADKGRGGKASSDNKRGIALLSYFIQRYLEYLDGKIPEEDYYERADTELRGGSSPQTKSAWRTYLNSSEGLKRFVANEMNPTRGNHGKPCWGIKKPEKR